MATVLRIFYENLKAQVPKLSVFVDQTSMVRHYYIQKN